MSANKVEVTDDPASQAVQALFDSFDAQPEPRAEVRPETVMMDLEARRIARQAEHAATIWEISAQAIGKVAIGVVSLISRAIY